MKKLLIATLFYMAAGIGNVNASTPFDCSIFGSVEACAARAIQQCGYDNAKCLADFGFESKYSTGQLGKKWCGLSKVGQAAIVYGNCTVNG